MIIGIDIGTQSLKVVVLDDHLKVCGSASSTYQPTFPKSGWAEQDPEFWTAALAPTIARALSASGAQPGNICGLGVGGQLDGCIAVDRACKPVHSCLIWMDRRAEKEILGLPLDEIRAKSGVVPDATHMAAKIRWLKANVPAADGCLFHQPTSYVVHRLTGRAVMDHGLASTTMLYGLASRAFDEQLLELFGIDKAVLPALADATDRAGTLNAEGARLTGLAEGIPVAVGTGDDFSTPLGGGIVEPGRLACVLGTAEVVGAVHSEPVIDTRDLVQTHAFVGNRFFIETPGWLSGGALAWFKDTFRLSNFAELDALAEAVSPGAEGITFLPALSGTMAPEWVASARGCFYGLASAHGTGHMARAVLEGTAFAMRDVLERLIEMGLEIEAIRLLGGGAKSRTWARIRADLTSLPVEISEAIDTAPIGSALLAAVAVGVQPDLLTAASRVGGVAETIEPTLQHKTAYEDGFANYRKLFETLKPIF